MTDLVLLPGQRRLPLFRKGIGIVGYALVDSCEYDGLMKYTWRMSAQGYARRSSGKKFGNWITLHRHILDAKPGQIVDHINRDVKDNRRANLRFCSKRENNLNRDTISRNTSGYTGVSWCTRAKKYWARIHTNGKTYSLGYSSDPAKCYEMYCQAAERLHGNFAQHLACQTL